MGLRSPKATPLVLRGVRPNQGLEAEYRKKLDALVDEMQRSIVYWITAAYRGNTPEMAQDASPAVALRSVIRRLTRRWQSNFDTVAPQLAKHFAMRAADRSDKTMKAILKEAGFTVDFKLTAPVNDVIQATIGEQVGLIKSIAAQHLAEVDGLVMRSIAAGRDLGTLTKSLEERYGITKRRAALIARDQNNKATATITRARQEGLGIKEAIWLHSHAGKNPRASHVAASGKTYDIAKGMFIDGEWIWPGTAINCRCVSKPIIPGFTSQSEIDEARKKTEQDT